MRIAHPARSSGLGDLVLPKFFKLRGEVGTVAEIDQLFCLFLALGTNIDQKFV